MGIGMGAARNYPSWTRKGTERRQRIIAFVASYHEQHRRPPSIREIGTARCRPRLGGRTASGVAAREAEDRLVAAGADLTHTGDPRVTWFTVASGAIVAALRDFEAERSAGYRGQA